MYLIEAEVLRKERPEMIKDIHTYINRLVKEKDEKGLAKCENDLLTDLSYLKMRVDLVLMGSGRDEELYETKLDLSVIHSMLGYMMEVNPNSGLKKELSLQGKI